MSQDFYAAALLLSLIGVLMLAVIWTPLAALSAPHPFVMGFIKFALLATFGSRLKVRIRSGRWIIKPLGTYVEAIIWGLIGITVTWAFSYFSHLVDSLIAAIPWLAQSGLFVALAKSLAINLIFAYPMMWSHEALDQFARGLLENKYVHETFRFDPKIWGIRGFIVKTIILFWVPAHTVTFILPAEIRILMAAALSVVLGVLITAGSKLK